MVHRLLSLFRARLAAGAAADALHTASAAAGVITCGALTEAPLAGDSPRVLLFPMGKVATRDGRNYRLDDLAHANRVIAASVAHAGRRQIPCDYDHQLVYGVGAAGPNKVGGGQAPAAGWIDPATLAADAQGIWATVNWTQTAAARLAAREYRYLSPSFHAGPDGRLSKILYLSLVNDNAIDELPAVASTNPETPNMQKIATALGLPADASEEAILAAIAKMTAPPAGMATASANLSAEAIKTAAAALGLGADATVDQIITAAASVSATPDPTKFVPIAALKDTTDRLAALETERHDRLLTAAAEAGKITPALRPWAAELLKKDEAAFTAFVAAATPIVTAGAHLNGPAAEQNAHGLTAEEIQTAAAFGLKPEEYAAAKPKG
jgi:phage I-like protein